MNSPHRRSRNLLLEGGAYLSPSKRQRTARDEQMPDEGFMRGAIVRIALRNFVTYDRCEFFPGPHLNMIIGPNGTGKSTIVCAMALGLGGNPSLLGRSKEVSDFVKHGHDKAIIDVELYRGPPEQNVVIKRQIKRSTNASTWKIDGQNASQRDVLALAQDLRIQVDNLCQFLPQDRVGEFAQMSPSELLVETQKAAGEAVLSEYHARLIADRKEEKQLAESIDQETTHVDQLSKRNAVLERDVIRFQERENIMKQVAQLKIGLLMACYGATKNDLKEAKDTRKKMFEEHRRLEHETEPFRRRQSEFSRNVQELEREQRNCMEEQKKGMRTLEGQARAIDQLVADSDAHRQSFHAIRNREKQRKARIRALQDSVQELQRQLPASPPSADTSDVDTALQRNRDETNALREQQSTYKSETIGIQNDGQEIQSRLTDVQMRLSKLDNIRSQRLELVRRTDQATYRAAMWLEKNRDMFSGAVYGPICLEVNVKDRKYANAVELAIGRNMMTFVCTNKSDYNLFARELIDKQRLRVSVVCFSKSLDNFQSPVSKEELAEWGLEAFLIETVEAPDAVLVALCEQNKLHQVPFAHGKVDEDAVIASRKIGAYIANGVQNTIRFSAYGKREASVQAGIVREARLLATSVNVEEKNRLIQEADRCRSLLEANAMRVREIKVKEQEANSKLETLQQTKDSLIGKKRYIQAERNAYDRACTHLESRQSELKRMLDEPDCADKERAELQEKLNACGLQRSQAVIKLKDLAKHQRSILERRTTATLKHLGAFAKLRELQNAANAHEEALRATEKAYHEANNRYNEKKAEAKRRLDELTKATADLDDETREIAKQIFNTKTLAEIEDDLVSKTAQADLTHAANPRIIKEYEERKETIEQLYSKLKEKEDRLQQLRDGMSQARSEWEPKICALVNEVSASFSAAFKAIKCSGEVRLHRHDDYDQWGIEIMVKFRDNEEMQALNGQRQSGGERSVSTILYLMALQQRAKSPFRVVDEINQGMDPRNERMVHQRLVEVSCRPDTPQYFLVTPKLLPNLVYHDMMKVLCIFNGEWQPEKFHIKGFLRQRKKLVKA
ncbi:hypothetical protein THASP1DRAFT_27160 [Thamnocephalis sphaerospora]|uniref:Structural maintenance of chromosomes protein 5 n=1 Tax=Thamnocephalis sphaerospora TaxID=78915 RepID=A0A4P9XZ85_9FUNG|nr:hypothetical protein THASP1DRAFT_27160 [Thamnocephalis sphaerospora]|eukprot:RKP11061.1 hypothetical protein THASP1DRAFT_27160 [Thamnocephalis sphaerospora]